MHGRQSRSSPSPPLHLRSPNRARAQEWFPSISATIGDWYPERNYFQIGMALASGPRFALVIGGYWIMRDGLAKRGHGHLANRIALVVGIIRTVRAPPADREGWHSTR